MAPNADRMASSGVRSTYRVSIRRPRFAPIVISSRVTAISSPVRIGFMLPSSASRSGTATTVRPASASACSLASSDIVADSSARAPVSGTCRWSRPMTWITRCARSAVACSPAVMGT